MTAVTFYLPETIFVGLGTIRLLSPRIRSYPISAMWFGLAYVVLLLHAYYKPR